MQRIIDSVLAAVHWLNAEPGRKRGLTIILGFVGQALRKSSNLQGVAPWLDQLVAFINTDMVPLVDLLTEATAVIALWHPLAKKAAERSAQPPIRLQLP